MLFRRIKRIPVPILSALTLGDDLYHDIRTTDLNLVGPLFSEVREDTAPCRCDVLLLYCCITPAGAIQQFPLSLRELIAQSGASITIVATEHPIESYIAAAPVGRVGQTHLVMTLKRNDAALAAFLAEVFAEMKNGAALPACWSTVDRRRRAEASVDLVYSAEISPVSFH